MSKESGAATTVTMVTEQQQELVITMTAEQVRELDSCLRLLLKKVVLRTPEEFWEGTQGKFVDALWKVSRGNNTGRKLSALFYLTRLVMNANGFDPLNAPNDPLVRPFARGMDLLCEFGLAERKAVAPGTSSTH
jgi:hypothetical protein